MTKLKIKKGDDVIVIAGKDKGKRGKVLKVFVDDNKAIVSGVNKVIKHVRPSAKHQGGRVEMEAKIHISNVSLIDPRDSVATRVGFKKLEDGTKVRFSKKSGEVI